MRGARLQSNQYVADTRKRNELEIIGRDFASVLGFPMGLVGNTGNTVIARSGTIARIRDVLTKYNNEFLVDAFVFPGNNGSPVINKPEAIGIRSIRSLDASYLIGITKSYVPYDDVAVSLQTQRPREIFEENSGLAGVHPIVSVQEIIRDYLVGEKVVGKKKLSLHNSLS